MKLTRHDWMRDVCLDLAAYAAKNNLTKVSQLFGHMVVEMECQLREYRSERLRTAYPVNPPAHAPAASVAAK